MSAAAPPPWVRLARDVFACQIGEYEACVSDSDSGECWRWSLEHHYDGDLKVEFARGYFVGDADGAKARAEEMAAVLMGHPEPSLTVTVTGGNG